MDYIRKERNVTYNSDACKMYLRHDFRHTCAYCGIIEEAHYVTPLVADGGFQKDHFYPQNGTGIDPLPSTELHAYCELKLMQRAGVISDLRMQVSFELIPSQRVDGKVVERAVNYIADFVYQQDGQTVVEDTKGFRTKDYILKRKLMLWRHGIRVREV